MKEINRSEYLDFFIKDFLESYVLYHDDEEIRFMIKKIILKKEVDILPSYLKVYPKEELSLHLSNLILKNISNEKFKKYNLEQYIDVINMSNIKPAKKHNNSILYKLKRKLMIGTITTMTALSGFSLGTKDYSNKHKNDVKTDNKDVKNTETKFKVRIVDVPKNIRIKEEKELKKIKKTRLKQEKINVLNNYSEYNTIDKITSREKELEEGKLTDDDKLYKNCKLSAEVQQFIYEQSILNKMPADFTFAIIHTETRGKFDSSEKVSVNGDDNYDIGLTQQNTKYSLPQFQSKYNLSYEDAYNLLKNNDYANVVSAFIEYEGIAKRFDNYDPYEYAGCYNGWLNWSDKDISLQYVEVFKNAYDNIYTQHHTVEKEKVLSK